MTGAFAMRALRALFSPAGLGVLALLALLAATVAIGVLRRDLAESRAVNAGHDRCLAAVKGQARAGAPETSCDPAIAQAAAAQSRSEACDAGLRTLSAGVPDTCSGAVRTVVLERDGARADLADERAAHARTRAARAAAVAGAVRRATTHAERTSRARSEVARLPRSPAGAVVCDDQCLRRLAGD